MKHLIYLFIIFIFYSCTLFLNEHESGQLYDQKILIIEYKSKLLEEKIQSKYDNYIILTLKDMRGLKKKYILYYDSIQNASFYHRFEVFTTYSFRFGNSKDVKYNARDLFEDFERLELPDFTKCKKDYFTYLKLDLIICYNGNVTTFFKTIQPKSECWNKKAEIKEFSQIIAEMFFEHIDSFINRGDIEFN